MNAASVSALLALATAVLAVAGLGAPAAGQDDESAAAGGSAADTTAADSTAAPNPRTFLSTDGAIRVYEELRPGEGINGFWWEYDPQADLTRLLDDDLRDRPLDKLTDAFGFQIFAPDSIVALRDSVSAVADSIRATRVDLKTTFDPKLTSRYSENRDSFDFVNELTSPVPLPWGTLTTTLREADNFNESTNKVRDDRSLATSFTRRFGEQTSSTVSFNRSGTEQRRGDVLESRSNSTSVNARVLGQRSLGWAGTASADLGLAGGRDTYRTEITDGSSEQLTPSWGANFKRPLPAGNLSLDYKGSTDRGRRRETRQETVLDENNFPVLGPDGEPLKELLVTETDDRNLANNLQFSGDTKLGPVWTVRLSAGLLRDRMQYIAQEDSVAGRQETRRSTSDNANLHVEGKPWTGFELKLDGRVSRSGFDYDLERSRFSRTNAGGTDAEVRWSPTSSSNWTVRLGRSREDRNSLTAQSGIVDKESANLNWKQILTDAVDFTANYDVTLDSFVFDDKVANTGDRDLRNQRGIFTVNYIVSPALNTAVKMDVRKNDTVNVNAQKSRENKSDYAYIISPTYSLRAAGNSVTGEFSADARYAVYDFDEDRNFLTRRFSTRQRWQRSLLENVTSDVLGTYEISDEGAYRRGDDGIRRFGRSREVHRFRIETQILYTLPHGLQFRTLYRRDGDNQYVVTEGEKQSTGRARTDEFSVGVSGKKRFLKSILTDLDASWSRKAGDRVTDVDRRFFTIRLSLEYQPFRKPGQNGGGA